MPAQYQSCKADKAASDTHLRPGLVPEEGVFLLAARCLVGEEDELNDLPWHANKYGAAPWHTSQHMSAEVRVEAVSVQRLPASSHAAMEGWPKMGKAVTWPYWLSTGSRSSRTMCGEMWPTNSFRASASQPIGALSPTGSGRTEAGLIGDITVGPARQCHEEAVEQIDNALAGCLARVRSGWASC